MNHHTPPEGAIFDFLDVGIDTAIRYAYWPKEGAKGCVLLLPGFSEFIEKYFEVVGELLDRGLAVFAIDWRSQGLSSRPLENRHKVHIESFEQYLSDLHRFIEVIVRPKVVGPFCLLAHSMGGHIALRYAHDHGHLIDAMALSAPMVNIRFAPGMKLAAQTAASLALLIGQEEAYILGAEDYGAGRQRFEGNQLTSDEERFARAHAEIEANPGLAIGGPTYGWLAAALRSIKILGSPGFAESIRTPIHLVGAGADRIVSTPAKLQLAKRLPNAETSVIKAARHEILMERDAIRAQFYDAFDDLMGELT